MANILHTKSNTLNNTAGGIGIASGSAIPSGSFLTSTGAGGTSYTINTGAGITNNGVITGAVTSSWANTNTNFTSTNGQTIMTIPYGEDKVRIEKKATLEVNGTVVMNGMDLDERLKTIEQVLCIPQRDVTMEEKHPKLKALYEQYMHELEKYKTWERIKGDDNGTT